MKVGKGNDFRNTWFTWLIKSSIPFLKRKIPSRFVPWQDHFFQDISLAGHCDLLCLTGWWTALSAFDKKKKNKNTHISLGRRDEVLKGHIAQCLRVWAPKSNCLGLLLAMWPWASYLSLCLSLLICKMGWLHYCPYRIAERNKGGHICTVLKGAWALQI